jgi:TPR repeat protein
VADHRASPPVGFAAVVLAAFPAAGGPFEDAAAEAKGDFKATLTLYQAAANKGSDEAKLAIGSMYLKGRGVKKTPKLRSSGFAVLPKWEISMRKD